MAGVTPVELQTGETRSVRLEVAGHSLALAQDPSSGNHGHVVWDAAGDLAKYLLEGSKRRDVRGKRVVEVGSGTGAAGLLLAMAGATVALTDLPSVVPLLAANAARVLGSARVRIHRGDGAAECGDDDESPAHRSGSHAPETDPLLRGVESLMGPSTVAILANERRCEDTFDAFVRACKDRFRVRAVPRKQMPPEAPESMYILELRLKRHR
ncbi:hypothetical protein FNF29_08271 [Cafeteria roenbergensis]|uniref:Methyltransferase small domain-containing protein n=1 Tax=Cafeteria roenbergensis TaxID=33653 RepID=A0A5A8C1T6_CAFRO|nr:hypothetical protein FNF29_08271 [Cafeteria roenbergensis]|eukprot:KAA0146060.1 hypothetical protein FNF29_08271 [Cafeteria roenbergensis]